MTLDDILLEWSYRLPKGYPTMKDGKFTSKKELKVLQEILAENGINEMPDFTKKAPVSEVIVEADLDVPKKTTADLAAVIDIATQTGQAIGEDKPKTLAILYNRIAAFDLYKPIKNALAAAGFKSEDGGFDMPKQIANELQRMLEAIPPEMYPGFMEYIQKSKNDRVQFPNDATGNFKTLLAGTGISDEMTIALAKYTGQDEGKKGVGMAEIMMALAFGNISKPEVKGDLYLKDVGEFEIKGYWARLGSSNGPQLKNSERVVQALATINCTVDGPKIKYKEKSYEAPKGLAAAAIEHPDKIKGVFVTLLQVAELPVIDLVNMVGKKEWTDAVKLNRLWGLCMLQKYREKETFQAFLACDLGASAKSPAPNTGAYIFGQGETLLETLWEEECGFQGFNLGSTSWPRIAYKAGGQSSNDLEESYED